MAGMMLRCDVVVDAAGLAWPGICFRDGTVLAWGKMSKRVRKFVKLLKSAYLVGDTSAAVGARALRVVEDTMRTSNHTGIGGCSSVVGGVYVTLLVSANYEYLHRSLTERCGSLCAWRSHAKDAV